MTSPTRTLGRSGRAHYQRTRSRRRLAVRVLPRDDRVAQHADALDLRLHHVAGPQVERRSVLAEPGNAGHRPGRDDVAGRVAERRVVGQDLRDRHGHPPGVRLLARLAVDAQLHRQVVQVGDLVGRHDPRPERAERVDRLAEREDAGLHLAPLDVARGDVVEDHEAADVVARLLGREPLARPGDDDGELELVVELLGQVLGVDDRVVRPDDRVHVLEEDDPGRDPVRPVDALRLLLVLAEVAGRVEELLRDDRRPQAALDERPAASGLGRPAAALEERAHVRRVELHDGVAAHVAHDRLPADLERRQPHRLDATRARRAAGKRATQRARSQARTSAAFRSGGNTG